MCYFPWLCFSNKSYKNKRIKSVLKNVYTRVFIYISLRPIQHANNGQANWSCNWGLGTAPTKNTWKNAAILFLPTRSSSEWRGGEDNCQLELDRMREMFCNHSFTTIIADKARNFYYPWLVCSWWLAVRSSTWFHQQLTVRISWRSWSTTWSNEETGLVRWSS